MSTDPQPVRPPELWAGVECTIARVRERWINQMARLGHTGRLDDLDRFAALGIKALRFPVLWEEVAPDHPHERHWGWTDRALDRLRGLGVRPILGLLHHGSGPRYTGLTDPRFPELLAAHAGAVAERYPWAEAYTPLNEPLTTARFSGLYGHWYPHGNDHGTFVRCLLNECRATVLAMHEVRRVNPRAILVQTDDLGQVFSTPRLAYQAEFENERRWLAWDLISGRVTPKHSLYRNLRHGGATAGELAWFEHNACPPDVIGVNHYLSSSRYLDEDLRRYPEWAHGGNGQERYADVLAARVVPDDLASPCELLLQAWERYGTPLAITEVHNGCTREEQMRWLQYVWDGAIEAARSGANVQAVTAWALLGAYDWDSLLTLDRGHYEPGVFDVRAPQPRATGIAKMVSDLAAGREPDHPVLASPGWWHRRDRYHFGHSIGEVKQKVVTMRPRPIPILITGATGTLGGAFARLCVIRGLAYRLVRRSEMDIADSHSVAAMLDHLQPWALVNTAGYVRVDDAEVDCDRCFRENTTGPATLALACAERGIRLVTFSSDLVFDGSKGKPYLESDGVSPLNEYGHSKAQAEELVLAQLREALVVRTSAFFGPWDAYNFVTIALQTLASGARFTAAQDAIVSPTYVPDLVHATLDLLIDGERGIWHLANQGAMSWADLARLAAARAGLDPAAVLGVPAVELGLPAPRPHYSVLGSERGDLLPTLEHALTRYLRERSVTPADELRSEFEAAA